MIRSCEGEGKPWFSVFIVYDGHESGRQAFRVFQNLVDSFGDEFKFNLAMLKVAEFADPVTSRQASYDLTQTDLILVSVKDEAELTDEFRDWAESWPAATQHHECLLSAMLNDAPLKKNYEGSFLHRLAVAKNMDFISSSEQAWPAADQGRMRMVRPSINLPRGTCHRVPAR